MIPFGCDDDRVTCHSCGLPVTGANESVVEGTCATCLAECPCWICREHRDDIAQDRAEQADLDAYRDTL